jgi:hypothetical protein
MPITVNFFDDSGNVVRKYEEIFDEHPFDVLHKEILPDGDDTAQPLAM